MADAWQEIFALAAHQPHPSGDWPLGGTSVLPAGIGCGPIWHARVPSNQQPSSLRLRHADLMVSMIKGDSVAEVVDLME